MKKNVVKKNNTTLIIILGVVLLLFILGTWMISSYNGLVTSEEQVNAKWANVQSAYQRRADLVPNLVAVVQQAAEYESSLLTAVTQARASVGSAQTPSQLQAAGTTLDSAISRLLVVVENYPTLQATQNYQDLQVQLEGTENRIKTERDVYNSAVQEYNVKVRRFPTSILAGMYGFERKESFSADSGAENAPNVNDLFATQ